MNDKCFFIVTLFVLIYLVDIGMDLAKFYEQALKWQVIDLIIDSQLY